MLFGLAAENFVSGLFWIILTLSTKHFVIEAVRREEGVYAQL
jgi:hypothetical protein